MAEDDDLHQLWVAFNSHFSKACNLKKLAEGDHHEVDTSPSFVFVVTFFFTVGVRCSTGRWNIACCCSCRGSCLSQGQARAGGCDSQIPCSLTRIPVPRVYAWNSDASNPVGAEYMIMHKVSGISANTKWDTLSMSVKERVVSQVAEYLKVMFALRFDRTGALYLSSPPEDDVYVGPIVSVPFYRAADGIVRVPEAEPPLHIELSQYRGPFSNTSDYLQSFLHAELHVLSHHRSVILSEMEEQEADEEVVASRLELGERILRKALELCSVYPGNNQPGGVISTSTKPFSLHLDDFRLSNIMINEKSGDVTSLIDFEGATIAPLWECAVIPAWIQDPDDQEGGYEGGPAEDREKLREIFCKVMDSREWSVLYEQGTLFRHFRLWLSLQVACWASEGMEEWVDKRLAWARLHPGVALSEDDY